MSEKRFELAYETIQEINKNGEIIDILTDDEVVDLLNKQSEEIQYWRHKANSCLWIMSGHMGKYSFRALLEEIESDGFDLKDKELKEINDLEIKLVEIRRELFCKDRKLEELGIPIECCDTDD